jgi:oxygen-independent coproporphyrinogen-3 oxidase
MNIELNIDSEEFLYESQILVKSFLSEKAGKSGDYCLVGNSGQLDKTLKIEIEDHQITVSCEDIQSVGIPEGPEKKYVKAEMKRQIYKVMKTLTGVELPWGALTGIRPTKIAMGLLEENEKITDREIAEYLKSHYMVSDEKIVLSTQIARREKRLLQNIDYQNGYSLYIGIPFCPTTCLYCSFTSYPIGAYEKKTDAYVEALKKEISYAAEAFRDKKLNSVYFGGGTPTTLTPEQLDQLLMAVRQQFDFSYNQEFTVEAGRPDSITEEKLKVLKKHGVTRISINPQTMKQETLDLIGRYHTAEQVRDAFALARKQGFDNINMDFIVGLPGETAEDVKHTMEEALALGPDSITVHSLALKRAARLNIFKDSYQEMSMKNNQEIMEICQDFAERMDMSPYYMYRQKNMAGNMENVGYAREGKEGIYNILIMEEKQTILALGAGAVTKYVMHSQNRIERVENVKNVDQYIDRIDEMIARKKKFLNDRK